MIDAYVWTTPNGFKALITLEELGLPYRTRWVNIGKGEQMTPEYLAINPNNKIPAIIDPDGPDGAPITVFESGAIAIYLCEKTGSPLLAPRGPKRYTQLEWMAAPDPLARRPGGAPGVREGAGDEAADLARWQDPLRLAPRRLTARVSSLCA